MASPSLAIAVLSQSQMVRLVNGDWQYSTVQLGLQKLWLAPAFVLNFNVLLTFCFRCTSTLWTIRVEL